MDYFHYRRGQLYCEEVPVSDIVERYSTPLYIYSLKTVVRHFQVTSRAFGDIPHLICYSAKANPNLAILKTAALCGAGCDVVSAGELKLALRAGIRRKMIVFSGVGKTDEEIELAIRSRILFISAESIDELETIARLGRRNLATGGVPVPVAIRVNPEIDPETHPFVATGLKETKFGLDEKTARAAYLFCKKSRWLDPVGISMHIGSQVQSVGPYVDATTKLIRLFNYLWKQNVRLKYIDIGGGWAAQLRRESKLPHPDDYVSALKHLFSGLPVTVIVEPGRSIVGNAGILVMRVIATKKSGRRNFCIVDAGLNDFLRPALYGASHPIEPVFCENGRKSLYEVVGPVCETADYFSKEAKLPKMKKGDLLALFTAGAYGSAMSSNYNSRGRAAEVVVAGDRVFLVRNRETYRDLLKGQSLAGIDDRLIGRLIL